MNSVLRVIEVGWNQTSFPDGSRIIGPFWVGPNWGVRKMSPLDAGAELRVTVIDAGVRSGRERKCWSPFEPAGTRGTATGGSGAAGFSTRKLN